MLEIQGQETLEQNKCPKCKEHQLSRNETRWGVLRICSNYPKCDFTKKEAAE
ncbi:topoisomerase DNA-binding C4 zinc finger domain-containing protein [Rhodobacteraceae bacterium nBUS_22]